VSLFASNVSAQSNTAGLISARRFWWISRVETQVVAIFSHVDNDTIGRNLINRETRRLTASESKNVALRKVTLAVLLGLLPIFLCFAQPIAPQRGRTPQSLAGNPKRARPPVWSTEVLETFFPDARSALVGPRPDYTRAAGRITRADASSGKQAADGTDSQVSGTKSGKWSQWIDAETLETEIKRIAQKLATSVTTPGPFKSGGFQDARLQFSLLAALFAVSGEYDESARWQEVAPSFRNAFATAGRNAKVGSDQTYNEAVARKKDLELLILGERPTLGVAERLTKWGDVSDRPPLMQRLSAAHQERLSKWLAHEREFAANREEIRHEAQIVTMLAEIISREGFEFWDDPNYAEYAKQLRDAAKELSTAAAGENFNQARQALGRAAKACADCHEGYRG
jgi:hypothetical protein